MLGLAKRIRARILLSTSSEVYGDAQVHPQTEDYWGNVNPIGIRSCYDEGKRVAETLMMDYHRQNRVDDPDRPHLQHLRPADGRRRRPGRQQLHRPGPQGRAPDGLRRREPDALVLLRLRPHRGAGPHDGRRRLHRPGQPGQPGRVHHPRAGREGPQDHRQPLADRPRRPPLGRPRPPLPRHHPGRDKLGWKPHGQPGGRTRRGRSPISGTLLGT